MASLQEVDAGAPAAFHLLAKPSGSTCVIDCAYCFFLSKETLYPSSAHRVSKATLETYLRQLLESHPTPHLTVAWHGGDPRLMKLDFFRQSVAMVEQLRRPGQIVKHTFQTNGILLDDEWCAFFKEHDFLIGLSVDGPRDIHDTYGCDRGVQGNFDRVMNGWAVLRRHGVDFNILCTVSAANERHGTRVYRFLRDELQAGWMQFIPIVERATAETIQVANPRWSERNAPRPLYTQTGDLVTTRSVGGEQYGRFLVEIFEEWVRHDVGRVHVQLFDGTLEAYFGRHVLYAHAPTHGYGPALEYNGELYSSDHFIEPEYLPRNARDIAMPRLVTSPQERKSSDDARDTLTAQCRSCEVAHLCRGGSPKHRFALSRDGEPGQNYLCAGLEFFFTHTRPAMRAMAVLLTQGHPPSEVMAAIEADDTQRGAYRPCPCGSSKKFRFCHGNHLSRLPVVGASGDAA